MIQGLRLPERTKKIKFADDIKDDTKVYDGDGDSETRSLDY